MTVSEHQTELEEGMLPHEETGESEVGFQAALADALRKIDATLGEEGKEKRYPGLSVTFQIDLEHHSPSHVKIYRVIIGPGT
jgi:hypothetical protein